MAPWASKASTPSPPIWPESKKGMLGFSAVLPSFWVIVLPSISSSTPGSSLKTKYEIEEGSEESSLGQTLSCGVVGGGSYWPAKWRQREREGCAGKESRLFWEFSQNGIFSPYINKNENPL